MSDDQREILARQQRDLIDALASGNAPDGFDPSQMQRSAHSLAIKRMRTAQKSWRALAAAVGDQFDELFATYAARHPLTDHDARQFVQFLLREQVDPELKLRLCCVRASYGFPACFAMNQAGAALAIRMWGGGVRAWTVRRRRRRFDPARQTR